MLSIIFWVAFGATIGWAAVIIREIKNTRLLSAYILTGAIGGFAGGYIGALLDPTTAGYHTTTTDMVFAVFGATAFVVAASRIIPKGFNQQN